MRDDVANRINEVERWRVRSQRISFGKRCCAQGVALQIRGGLETVEVDGSNEGDQTEREGERGKKWRDGDASTREFV